MKKTTTCGKNEYQPKLDLKKVMRKIKAKVEAQGELPNGGIVQAVMNLIKDHEPRYLFIACCDIARVVIDNYADKEFRKLFEGQPGFETKEEGYRTLKRIEAFWVEMTDWKKDRFLQLHRYESGQQTEYTPGEVMALEQLYMEEFGNNEPAGPYKRNTIITADLYEEEQENAA